MDMRVQDGTGRVCKVENYQLDITDGGGYEQIQVSGRFYDPDYGYVVLQTISPFIVYYNDEYPSSGQLVLTGATVPGSGPASIMLTAIDADNCQVEADIDGDGDYEGAPSDYDSGVIPWTEL